jgi:tetratricopeptide (TPR) repeat protein
MNINNAIKSAFENYQAGNLQQAEKICRNILIKKPNNVEALHFLGVIHFQNGQHDLAIEYIKKALRIDPSFADGYSNLGNIFQAKNQLDEAISCYRTALEINPKLGKTYFNLGIALQDKGQLDEAIACYQQAMQLNLNIFGLYYNLGLAFEKLHKLEEALSYYQKTIELNPNFFEAYNNMGNVFVVQGKLNEGISCFKKALQLKPDYTIALLNLVRNQRLNFDDSKELFELTKELIKRDMSENDSINVYFAMGKLCDNLNMFKESFEYYRLGNAIKRTQLEFNIDSHVDYLSRIRKTFSTDFIEYRKSWGSNTEMPIFIFGMPRSGTTLVEQIIASHPDVYGGGELQFFIQMEQKLPSILKVDELYPECLNFIDDKAAYDMAESYIKETREIAGLSKDFTRITDKNPFNFHHLGMISLLFPKASFIHCQRHPLDTCISIYFHEFSSGNHFAYDLRELGQYYREYLKLMNHWRNVLPINIFELKYEDMIKQQEEVSRKLVEFCGLEWNSASLDFYKKDRPVFTASNWQVRQPIYTTSCGRWKNYEQFLHPLKEVLADFL